MEIFDLVGALESYEKYDKEKTSLLNSILEDFEKRKEKVIIKVSDGELILTKGQLLVNLIVKRLLVGRNHVLSAEDIFTDDSLTEGSLYNYFNHLIDKTGDVELTDKRKTILNIISDIDTISGYLNVRAGNTISLLDLVRLSVEDPEFNKIINNREQKEMLDYTEMEELFDESGKKLLEYFANRPDSELYPFVKSGTGINKQQITQAFSMIGLKPDIEGNIIPHFMTDNYLTGLSGLESYYTNAIGARKALIINSRMVRQSGYLTKKVSLAMLDHYHDNDNKDCGTPGYVDFFIRDMDFLKQINERQYYDFNEDGTVDYEGGLKTTSIDNLELIGKRIALRSPVTCSAERPCATCYGRKLSAINKDINTGLNATFPLTEKLTQRLLSAKHLLTTNSEKIDWPKNFEDYFEINMNNVFLKDPSLNVKFETIPLNERDEEEEEPYTESVYVMEGRSVIASFKLPVYLYYDSKLESLKDEDEKFIIITDEDMKEDVLFTFQAINNELIKSLQDIIRLIESSDHLDTVDYNDMVEKFNSLVIQNSLSVASIHLEMITSILIRDSETKKRIQFGDNVKYVPQIMYDHYYKTLDSIMTGKNYKFKKDNIFKYNLDMGEIDRISKLPKDKLLEEMKIIKPYSIVRISNVILDGPLSKSLAFERLAEQLTDPETYEKEDSSLMDFLYI